MATSSRDARRTASVMPTRRGRWHYGRAARALRSGATRAPLAGGCGVVAEEGEAVARVLDNHLGITPSRTQRTGETLSRGFLRAQTHGFDVEALARSLDSVPLASNQAARR